MKSLSQFSRSIKKALIFILSTYVFCTAIFEAASEKTDKILGADELLEQNNLISTKYMFEFRNRTFIGKLPFSVKQAMKLKILSQLNCTSSGRDNPILTKLKHRDFYVRKRCYCNPCPHGLLAVPYANLGVV